MESYVDIGVLCTEFLSVFEAALGPGEGTAIFERARHDVSALGGAVVSTNKSKDIDRKVSDEEQWESVGRKGKGSKTASAAESSSKPSNWKNQTDTAATASNKSRGSGTGALHTSRAYNMGRSMFSEFDLDRIQQRAVDEALNMVLLQPEPQRIATEADALVPVPVQVASPAVSESITSNKIPSVHSYASVASQKSSKVSTSQSKPANGSVSSNGRLNHATTATGSSSAVKTTPSTAIANDPPIIPAASITHGQGNKSESTASCKPTSSTANAASNSSDDMSSLIHALDVSQQHALESLQSLFGQHVEVPYLIDLLFTYNFDVASATWALYEDIDKKQTYKAAAQATDRQTKHSFLKPPPPPVALGFVFPSRIEELVQEKARSEDPALRCNGYVSMFRWTREAVEANECRSTVQRLNPLFVIDIDPATGQLMFCGIKSKSQESNFTKQALYIAARKNVDVIGRAKATFNVNIDLHSLTVRQALEVTYSAIDYYKSGRDRSRSASQHTLSESYSNIDIVLVPGRGLHSAKGYSVLLLALQRYLHRFGYNFESDEARGIVFVHISRKL